MFETQAGIKKLKEIEAQLEQLIRLHANSDRERKMYEIELEKTKLTRLNLEYQAIP